MRIGTSSSFGECEPCTTELMFHSSACFCTAGRKLCPVLSWSPGLGVSWPGAGQDDFLKFVLSWYPVLASCRILPGYQDRMAALLRNRIFCSIFDFSFIVSVFRVKCLLSKNMPIFMVNQCFHLLIIDFLQIAPFIIHAHHKLVGRFSPNALFVKLGT